MVGAAWRLWEPLLGRRGLPDMLPASSQLRPRYFLINGVSFDQSGELEVPVCDHAGSCRRFGPRALRERGLAHARAFHRGANHGRHRSGSGRLAHRGRRQCSPRGSQIQSEVFLAAGKTQDVLINDPVPLSSVAVFDRHLSLSTNNRRGGGMMANIARTAGVAVVPVAGTGVDETYYCVAGTTLAVTDPSKGVLANDPGANGASLGVVSPASLSLTFNSDGTFTYTQSPAATTCGGSFTYWSTASIRRRPRSSAAIAVVATARMVAPWVARRLPASRVYKQRSHGLRLFPSGCPRWRDEQFRRPRLDGCRNRPERGRLVCRHIKLWFSCYLPTKTPALPPATVCRDLPYQAKTAQGTLSNTGHATVIFMPASGLSVVVRDAKTPLPAGAGTDPGQINDYRWIIEEDRTFYVDPKCQINSTDPALRPASCPRYRCRAWAITSTRLTCQSSPRAASARSRARPDKASVAVQLPSPATSVTAPAEQPRRKPSSIRATFTSIRPSAITISVLPGDGVNRRWPVPAARLKRRPEFSGSLRCPTIAPASRLALATAATPWAARRSPER